MLFKETSVKGSQLPAERDLVPYVSAFPPGKRWLVLAPHPDDEVIGPGATVTQAVGRGLEVKIVVVTDGGAQGDPAQREEETRMGAEVLGVGEPEFWRLPDRSLRPGDAGLRRALRGVLERFAPDVVFVTSPVELHPDHRALAIALQGALRTITFFGWRRRPPEWVAAYEVGSPLQPNLLVDSDEGWDAKRRAAACHAGQLAFRPYDQIMEALGTFRSLTLTDVARAEALYLLPARRVARLSPHAWASLMGAPAGVSPRRR
jgi:LmbE family N-acetylglucosaminyl deacetylase